jgi:hypothetical protein
MLLGLVGRGPFFVAFGDGFLVTKPHSFFHQSLRATQEPQLHRRVAAILAYLRDAGMTPSAS